MEKVELAYMAGVPIGAAAMFANDEMGEMGEETGYQVRQMVWKTA